MTVPEMSYLKTIPIPVKFDRQGHSCNFYVGFGPTSHAPASGGTLRLAEAKDANGCSGKESCRVSAKSARSSMSMSGWT